MKKTSRRSFGKQFAGALAAVPLASVSAKSDPQQNKPGQSRKSDPECIRTHENTPPPISINDGSLTMFLETAATATANPGNPMTNESDTSTEHFHKGNLNGSKSSEIVHIKVLHGSGDLLYQNLDATDSTVTVQLEDIDGGDVGALNFSAPNTVPAPGHPFAPEFIIRGTGPTAANRKLQYNGHGAGSHKDRHEFSHKGGAGGKEFRVVAIKVEQSGQLLFFTKAPLKTVDPLSQQYRVLLWLKES
ncbi:MAG: hypothetical protein QOH41_4243 [Blastocatellia bacterium]|jgi:hypothetical protein|nr:hypothetical protein [Blastocatellia bacterium]